MSIARAAIRRLRLPMPPSSCGGMVARQLHATTRRPNATEPAQYATSLPAQDVYHDIFPCTLHYYSWRGPTMALHGSSVNGFLGDLTSHLDAVEQDNLIGRDVVRVQEDGLVYPGPMSNDSVWNGAMLMPHAPFLLESTDNNIDHYEEQKAAGRNVPEPYFFTVPKGLRMPSTLFLAREEWEMFHLMPRAAMPLSVLNRELNELFSSSACSKLPYREWFRRYKVSDAYKPGGDLMSE